MNTSLRILHLENRIHKLKIHEMENMNLIKKATRQLRKLTSK